jgi:hypothetical protein
MEPNEKRLRNLWCEEIHKQGGKMKNLIYAALLAVAYFGTIASLV